MRAAAFTNFYAQPAVQRAYEEAKFDSEGAIEVRSLTEPERTASSRMPPAWPVATEAVEALETFVDRRSV